jgi:CRP-like cAMP-binding protein
LKNLSVLSKCPLFDAIGDPEKEKLLDCLSARRKKYAKNSTVFMEGDESRSVGIVLSGFLHIVQDDYWGNRDIIAGIEPGELFGEAFSCGGVKKLPVGVIAVEQSEILLVDINKILTTCSAACVFHGTIIRNMVRVLAQKNIGLMKKIEHITRRSTREKLLSYLSSQARQAKSGPFEIPFNRQELAEYLAVDRSAMSAELCRMRDAGMIRFNKNRFEILK